MLTNKHYILAKDIICKLINLSKKDANSNLVISYDKDTGEELSHEVSALLIGVFNIHVKSPEPILIINHPNAKEFGISCDINGIDFASALSYIEQQLNEGIDEKIQENRKIEFYKSKIVIYAAIFLLILIANLIYFVNQSTEKSFTTNEDKNYIEKNEQTIKKIKFSKRKKRVINLVRSDGDNLYILSDNFKEDRDVVLAAVSTKGNSLQYADEDFKSDKEIVTAAVEQNGFAFYHADKSLKNDKEFILSIINNYGVELYISKELKLDKEVQAAIKESRRLHKEKQNWENIISK